MIRRALRLPETILVRSLRLEPRYPPLFVVGAPRSGTTVVMQHIINTYEFAYFPNLSKAHPQACVFFGWWARRRHAFEPSYESRHGIIEGPLAPSDGWEILHRWFPRYDHSQPVCEERLYELRNIVRMFEMIFDAPFANKNNANSVRIAELHALFPRAVFVRVQRDFHDTVFSVLRSRRDNAVPPDEWWGASPPQFHDRSFADEFERVVYQTWGIERFIEASLERVPGEQQITVPYAAFCDHPAALTEWVAQRYANAGVTLRTRPGETPQRFALARREFEGRAEREREMDALVARLEKEQ
jgi:hypothetical protein